MKLLKWCIVIVLVFVGSQLSTPYLTEFISQFTPKVEESSEKEEESTPVNTVIEESRLKTLLTYLPFLGINISDVSEIATPKIKSSEALTFTYHDNVFSLYQVDSTSEESMQVMSSLKKNNMVEISDVLYVGVVASDYVVLVEEVHDLPNLVKSVKEINDVLGSLGFEKVSLKFE